MSKKFKLLFIISLILNALLVSFIGGKIYSHKTTKRGSAPLIKLLEGASIPDEKRAGLIAKLEKSSPDREGKKKTHRAWEEKTQTILRADVFDQAAYRAQLERRFLKNKPYKTNMIEVMVEIAAALNQEERTKMARILKRQKKRNF